MEQAIKDVKVDFGMGSLQIDENDPDIDNLKTANLMVNDRHSNRDSLVFDPMSNAASM